MIAEPYMFICKHCDKGYRGLVKTCPNCGAILRKSVTYSEETKEPAVCTYQKPYIQYDCNQIPENWNFDRIYYQDCVFEPDYVGDKLVGYSLVPKK